MLDRPKNVIPLPAWALEKRGRYWHIIKPQFFKEPGIDKGPYSTIMSACLMIARELAKEAVKRAT
jgi:hypothetical protein